MRALIGSSGRFVCGFARAVARFAPRAPARRSPPGAAPRRQSGLIPALAGRSLVARLSRRACRFCPAAALALVLYRAAGPPSPSQFYPAFYVALGLRYPAPVLRWLVVLPAGGASGGGAVARRRKGRVLRPPAGTGGFVLCLFCCLLLPFVLDRRAVVAALFG